MYPIMPAQITLHAIDVQIKDIDGSIRSILSNLSLNFKNGEKIGVLGRNGSGKTTLVRLLCGLDRSSKGKINKRPKSVRIMAVLQRPEEHFVRGSVGEQINSYAPNSLPPAEIHTLMEMVGLSAEFGHWPPLRLSSGQQRLVALACALASGAPFLVLDEPFAGLDVQGRMLVKNALIQLNLKRELGCIIVSHHPDDLLGIVDRLWILDKGKLVYDGLFQHVPLQTLEMCLSKADLSMYHWMRRWDTERTVLPDGIYKTSNAKEIIDYLQGVRTP
jgi:ABC-type multidrug transport system ATPase subunit